MSTKRAEQVALLIDFENLVRGIPGEEGIDCDVLFRLSEEYGRVLVANAYADWRMRDVNQYQTDLYRLGVDLIHVFGKDQGKSFKNAVDVKMAVDAISIVSTLPHISAFVIVSGDRDFIHVLKALRQQGKFVIGVSPKRSGSNDFAALCDRFVQYEALAGAYGQSLQTSLNLPPSDEEISLESVREVIATLISNHPEGIKGALIKPHLRRAISPSFDESNFGFSRFTDLLRHFGDLVSVTSAKDGSDVLVLPVAFPNAEKHPLIEESISQKRIRLAELSFYRFEPNAEKRRRILRRLFDVMRHAEVFSWEMVQERVLTDDVEIPSLSVTILSRYRTMILHGKGFQIEPNQEGRSSRERLMRLREDLQEDNDFIQLYEGSITYKLLEAGNVEEPLSPAELAKILGIDAEDVADLAYCQGLLEVNHKN